MRKLIGYVGIDSGMVAIGDPVYIDKVLEAGDAITRGDVKPDWNERAMNDERYLAIEDHSTVVENAIYGALVDTGVGDGFYPVYVTLSDLGELGIRVSKVEIDFGI